MLDGARFGIDNKVCRRAPFGVMLRPAHLAVRRHGSGADANANLYSLLKTCRVNGIACYCYLRAEMTTYYATLLPTRLALEAA